MAWGLRQMNFKQAVNATFFIIMVAILFLDAIVIAKYRDAHTEISNHDKTENLKAMQDMMENHIAQNNSLDYSKWVNWEKAVSDFLNERDGCVCIGLQLGVSFTLFIVHLGIMGLGIIVYVLLCGLQFHKSMYIINMVSCFGLVVGVSIETHFMIANDFSLNPGQSISNNGNTPDKLQDYMILKWVLVALNFITLCIQSMQCIAGHSQDGDDYTPEVVRTFSRRFRNSVRGFQDNYHGRDAIDNEERIDSR